MGLLDDRSPTHLCLSDASYGGLGAWSPHDHFDFVWRLTREDLGQAGFDMKAINEDTCKLDGTNYGLHINILEYIAIIIELWFVIILITRLGPRDSRYVMTLKSDNTSALSWMCYAARSH